MPRPKAIRTIDDARGALRELGGPECRVSVTQSTYEHFRPGSRYESALWTGSVRIEEDEEEIVEVYRQADSAQDLVTKIRVGLRDELTARARRRKLTHQQRGLPSPRVLCLEHRP